MTINTGFTLIDLEKFLMILMRITSFIYIAPFFNMANTPQRVKLGLGIFNLYGCSIRITFLSKLDGV